MVAPFRRRERIVLVLPRITSRRQERDLGAFVRYCVNRIEKELGEQEHWAVRITVNSELGYTSAVEVHHLGLVLETTGNGSDGEFATWDAMRRFEQLLRERRGSIVPRAEPREA